MCRTKLKMLWKGCSRGLVVTLQSQPHERLNSLARCPPSVRQREVILVKQNQLAKRERERETRGRWEKWFLLTALPSLRVTGRWLKCKPHVDERQRRERNIWGENLRQVMMTDSVSEPYWTIHGGIDARVEHFRWMSVRVLPESCFLK